MYVKKLNSTKLARVDLLKKRIKWNKAPSKGQLVLQDFLRPLWENHIVCAEWYIPGSKMRIDIVNFTKRFCVEYSPGTHHGKFNKFFHKNRSRYYKSVDRDYDKVIWCQENNFTLLELDETDIENLNIKYFMEKFSVNIV